MRDTVPFLSDLMRRPWTPKGRGFQNTGLFVGKGANAVEIVVARAEAQPTSKVLRDEWQARRAGRAAPVLLIILHPGGAGLCGPVGEKPPTYPKLDDGQVERLCREALNQPDRHAALRFLMQSLPSLETDLPGLNNEGLVALHELRHGTPKRADWEKARSRATAVQGQQGHDLLSALGFQIDPLDNLTELLSSGDRRIALAVMLRETEFPEADVARFNSLSPVSYALAKADAENLPWVMLVQGSRLRLYATATDAGVGRRGRTETYIECQLPLLADEHLPYLWLLYSAEALAPQGSLSKILDDSQRFAGDLANRLRERIYNEVVPTLAQGIAAARAIEQPSPTDLERTYEMALMVLFRLLFIAYAEDRDLLPYRINEAYRRRSLKQKAQELADCVAKGTSVAEGSSHWQEAVLLWQAVAAGNPEWGVPAYDGGLFSDKIDVSHTGAELARLDMPNTVFEAALRSLLVIETAEGVPGPVDFRSLGVREFGTIYEGLLESELALADIDLTLDNQGNYMPVRKGNSVTVKAGETYLHNRSGVRKSSGSYYTKHFAVEYLLDGALEPALRDHFQRLDEMDATDAAAAFFDFRVADISMGSGHFLIAAIDRIEKGMADFLTRRDLPGVRRELARLRGVAMRELGELAEVAIIEDGQLLRRMIARHCIYGVDLNALSVQLARLAVWIHTFVPGLPLSMLDHSLVRGNSLVGIGTIEDIRKKFEEAEADNTLFAVDTESLLGEAAAPLQRLANINDATLEDIAAAREAMQEVHGAIDNTKKLCDLITAKPISINEKVASFPFEDWGQRKDDPNIHGIVHAARHDLEKFHALHFPIAFPEVFLRRRQGFDVILGNPPWQEATIEEDAFWARYFPGLGGLPQHEQEAVKERLRNERPDLVEAYKAEQDEVEQIRKALMAGAYPGMGMGDPDLYKAFCWRFWHLTASNGGCIGIVLPRNALAAKGSTEFRQTIFKQSKWLKIVTLKNRKEWVFADVAPGYTISLVAISHGTPEERSIHLRGPFSTEAAFQQGTKNPAATFDHEEVLAWNDTASLPLLPDQDSIAVFKQLRKAPRLDVNKTEAKGGSEVMAPPSDREMDVSLYWRARPDGELHATAQKKLMTFKNKDHSSDGYWPVYKGASFNIWLPDTGKYYAWADPAGPIRDWLQAKRLKGGKSVKSPHSEFSLEHLRSPLTLPCLAPRIAFRDVTTATASRTVIACLVPPKVFLTNKAPYLLWPHGDEKDQAFLLGVLCSIPLDWYARRFVELNLNYFIFNPLPIPRPKRNDICWQRVVALAGRLACPDDRFSEWAEKVGVACGPLTVDEREDMIYELDALVAHLYDLDEDQLDHVFKTFSDKWDYNDHLKSVRLHYKKWRAR